MSNDIPLPDRIERLIAEREELRKRAREIDAELTAWAENVRRRLETIGVSFQHERPGRVQTSRAKRPRRVPATVLEEGPPPHSSQTELVVEIVRRLGRPTTVADVEAVLEKWGLHIPKSAMRSYLSHATSDGTLRRVAKGQYIAAERDEAVADEDASESSVVRPQADEEGGYHDAGDSLAGWSVPDAGVAILRQAGKRLHAKAILREMKKRGWTTQARKPLSVVVAGLHREHQKPDGRIIRVAPSTYALRDEVPQDDQEEVRDEEE